MEVRHVLCSHSKSTVESLHLSIPFAKRKKKVLICDPRSWPYQDGGGVANQRSFSPRQIIMIKASWISPGRSQTSENSQPRGPGLQVKMTEVFPCLGDLQAGPPWWGKHQGYRRGTVMLVAELLKVSCTPQGLSEAADCCSMTFFPETLPEYSGVHPVSGLLQLMTLPPFFFSK